MPKSNTQKTEHSSEKSIRTIERWSVKQLVDTYIYNIDLDADYQREKVWLEKDQEKLADSILHDIDIPKIYLAKTEYGFECIDGKQRMLAISKFFRPDKSDKKQLKVSYLGRNYTFGELKRIHPEIAKRMEDYKLDFVIYNRSELSEEYIRDIFIRLQLGIRLNSGEILNAHMGTIRDFIFKEVGSTGLFFRNTSLSDRRFSRQFTLAQICLNSFARKKTGSFQRARLDDLETFFETYRDIDEKDDNLNRIRKVLSILDKAFGSNASIISSRAVAVSAYLFAEELYLAGDERKVIEFSQFYALLLTRIKSNMKLLGKYQKPDNNIIMEDFQTYVSQATVEPYAIESRNAFLKKAFLHYLDPITKGKIIGDT